MSTRQSDSFDLLEATVADVHAAIEAGVTTVEALVDAYLARIDAYDDELNAILTLNDDALARARELDAHYNREGFIGPLHGVPVILKDNMDTHDMPTSAGSVVLAESVPARDAFVVARLRDAGVVVIAKANLQELSFGVDTISSLGGATKNPYALDRRPAGSSGGTAAAIAANLGLLGTGTDTCSSIRSPPAFNGLVGVRPTRGLVSRTGIVPLSETQDTAGPITRTVEDAARMLEVMAGFDAEDPVTARGARGAPTDGYVTHLTDDGLDGARIGVARQFFGVQDTAHAENATDAEAVTAVLDDAIEALSTMGATIVDPVDVVDVDRLLSARVIGDEFARDFDAYLATLEEPPVSSLAALVDTGTIAPAVESRLLDTNVLDVDSGSLSENRGYLRRLHRRAHLHDRTLSTLTAYDLDAICYPPSTVPPVRIPDHQPFSAMNCELSAHTGLPAIVVPAGHTDDGLPVGLELLSGPFEERRLLELAYAYEQATGHRVPPDGFQPLD